MALWLLLASLTLVCPDGFFSASEVTSGWPRMIKCRSLQMETFTCYWSYGDFNNGRDHVKLQYRTSDMHWRDCPDNTSGGDNSCFFSKEYTSVQSEFLVRLVSENSTSQVYYFTLNGIVEPDPPVALSWSLQNISINNSRLDLHVTWEPPSSSTNMLLLEYEVQIKEATEQWKSYDVVSTTYLPVHGLKIGKRYLLRVRCRLHGNKKFGEFSEERVVPVSVPALKSNESTGWPSITQCHSPQLETFTCHWTYGKFQNLPGSLKLQYMKPGINWTDCPDNVSAGENSCYFSKEHTSIWVGYLVRLVSENIIFDEYSFTVDDIVHTTAIPRSSSAVNNRGSLQKDLKKTYPSGWPSITQCRSPQQETFTCYWTYGNLRNLSGSLKLQYMKLGINWTDCPDNMTAGENSCYFSREYTSVWVGYLVRLVSENTTFDEYSFAVDDIVTPDPPISLNWTVLNVSATRLRMDIELKWDPPESADVRSGWITLEYEIQLKEVNETQWKVYDMVITTSLPVYALKIGKEYLIRIRCRRKGNDNFGDFSDVLLIPTMASVEPDFPWPLFLIIGIFAVLMVLAFILFCKKKRLKMLILPPVPVPKIKGIDPALLQKFVEVNGKNNLLEIQLEKWSRMWKISQTKQLSLAQECAALQEVIKGLQEIIELQCGMRDENTNLKKKINTLEEKLQDITQEYKKNIDSLMDEMRTKEENYVIRVQKIQREMEENLLIKEEEKHNLLSTKDKEISDLWKQLQRQEKEKQSEMIRQQIEFNAKLARIQSRNSNSYPDTNSLSQNIYRTKLQHLQQEKNKEIEILRNTIKDLERRLSGGSDSRLKRRRF